MPLSIRLDEGLEKQIYQAARRLHTQKSVLIRRCLERFLPQVVASDPRNPYQIYKRFEARIPGSGHGSLSVQHREEVLKRIRQGASR